MVARVAAAEEAAEGAISEGPRDRVASHPGTIDRRFLGCPPRDRQGDRGGRDSHRLDGRKGFHGCAESWGARRGATVPLRGSSSCRLSIQSTDSFRVGGANSPGARETIRRKEGVREGAPRPPPAAGPLISSTRPWSRGPGGAPRRPGTPARNPE